MEKRVFAQRAPSIYCQKVTSMSSCQSWLLLSSLWISYCCHNVINNGAVQNERKTVQHSCKCEWLRKKIFCTGCTINMFSKADIHVIMSIIIIVITNHHRDQSYCCHNVINNGPHCSLITYVAVAVLIIIAFTTSSSLIILIITLLITRKIYGRWDNCQYCIGLCGAHGH